MESMRFRVLACDYDRTIAVDALLPEPTRRSLREVAASGRRLLLVTGRTMEELLSVFGELTLFDRVVIENGAVVHDPATGKDRLLGPPVSPELVDALERRRLEPLVVGKVICSTPRVHENEVLSALADLRLDLKVSFNRDSMMVLPAGVSKATGFAEALSEVGEPAEAAVAVGDGENDLPFLAAAGVSVAVENAVPALKQAADITLDEPGPDGIVSLCGSLVREDLADLLEVSPATR
jgi:hydroxymethylpyrimidine pyrophosphatase-like HAD family hydrolase